MSDVVRQTNWIFRIPAESVEITSHRLDWGASRDLGELTAQRCLLLGDRLRRGAWFLCPRFTVYSPTKSADFFRAAREARSHWLMQARRVMGKGDLRREKHKAERLGRRAAYLDLAQPVVEGGPHEIPPEVVNLSDLPRDQREAVFLGGMLGKEMALTGIMFIDGDHILPWTWNRMADELLRTEAETAPITTHRRIDLTTLKATGDAEFLKRLSRDALQSHLDEHPRHAAYISPSRTVRAASASSDFFREVDRQKGAWCTYLNRELGSGFVRRAIRAADDETIALVYRGTLVVDGLLYLPGCWHNWATKPRRLTKTPFQAPTVPPAFLGLNPSAG